MQYSHSAWFLDGRTSIRVNLVKKYNETSILLDPPRKTRPRKLTGEMMAMLNEALPEDDEVRNCKASQIDAAGEMAKLASVAVHYKT